MGKKIRLPSPVLRFYDGSGNPLASGKLYTYENGTTTNKTTYQDVDGTTAHANPIVLDSRGEATVYWDGLYSIKVTDASDVTIAAYTQDDVGQGALEDEQRTAPEATTHNMASDADYALTAAQELYGRIIITDTSVNLTTGRNITCSTTERGYYFQNDTAQTLTFKTSAGTGISLSAGEADLLLCDGTNVVRPLKNQSVKQVVEATPYKTYVSTSGEIPDDDTIPQNTEGAEILTVSITPTDSKNRLRITATIDLWENDNTGAGGTYALTMALFQDSTADALAVSKNGGFAKPTNGYICHEMIAGTESQTTFKLRIGADSTADNIHINGTVTASGRRYGGIAAVRMRVEEIEP